MKRFWLAIFALALGFYCVSTPAQWNGCKAGFCSPVVASTGYQGPSDVFGAAIAWYSCSRGYSAAYAAPGNNPACDVVDTSTGLVTCTYHVGTNGFVNPSECTGAGQSCASACRVTKAYDQTGNGHDAVQATLATMPDIAFNSTPLGTLPAISCNTSSSRSLITAGTITQAQPLTFSGVYIRTSGVGQGVIGNGNTVPYFGFSASANLALLNATTALTASATDGSWHAVQGLANGAGTSSAIMVDGSDNLGAAGTSGFTSNLRLCLAASSAFIGKIAEAGVWALTSTPTSRGALNTNQHGSNGYNF